MASMEPIKIKVAVEDVERIESMTRRAEAAVALLCDADRVRRRDAYYQAALTAWLAYSGEGHFSLYDALHDAEAVMKAADEMNDREAEE